MDESHNPAAAEPDPDPEIEALLHFTPVHRHTRRRDGWPPHIQRGFIANLARMGSAEHAAYEVGRSSGGAWSLRKSGGGQEFADSWDAAIDLWHSRNPDMSRRGGRARGAWKPAAPPPPAPPPEPDQEAQWKEFRDGILKKYLLKLNAEREARLDGRIVEADFYVRQLSWLEVVLDLAGKVPSVVDLLTDLKRGGLRPTQIVATPMSLFLDDLRRLYWQEDGGPERPPPPPLGPNPGAEASYGEPPERQYCPERDGTHSQWQGGPSPLQLQRAEAQRLWEEKAKADAQEWARRVKGELSDGPSEREDGGGAAEGEAQP